MDWNELNEHEIKVYTAPACGDCRRLKSILREKGVSFTEVNIAEDPTAADHLVAQTGHRAIPYAEIDGKGMVKGWHNDAPGYWDPKAFLRDVKEVVGG